MLQHPLKYAILALSNSNLAGGQVPAPSACTMQYESLRKLKPLGIVTAAILQHAHLLYSCHLVVRFLLFLAFFCWFIHTFITRLWGSSFTSLTWLRTGSPWTE